MEMEMSEKKRQIEYNYGQGPAIKRKEMEIHIRKGQSVNLKSLLSGGRDRDYLISAKARTQVPISSLEGKHVLICHFKDPDWMSGTEELSFCHDLNSVYDEACRSYSVHLFQLVVVVVDGCPLDPLLLQKLSFDFLAAPFSDVSRVLPPPNCGCLFAYAVSPTGLVIFASPFVLMNYGSMCFPFTQHNFDHLIRRKSVFLADLLSPVSTITLPNLLQCDSLSRLGDQLPVPTSSLVGKTVGLYLYRDGDLMDDFDPIYAQCRTQHPDFELVLVPLPFSRAPDPHSFIQITKKAALERSPSFSSWLTFPYNEKVYRTLRILAQSHPSDQLVILPHSGSKGEFLGAFFLRECGISAYPFTRDVIVKRKMDRLRSQTLDALLANEDTRNKRALLYFGYNPFRHNMFYKDFKKAAPRIKKLYPDALLFLVLLESAWHSPDDNVDLRIPFQIVPVEKHKSLTEFIYLTVNVPGEKYRSGKPPAEHRVPHEALVAFGTDGKLLSRRAQDRSPSDYFQDVLYSELFDDLGKAEFW